MCAVLVVLSDYVTRSEENIPFPSLRDRSHAQLRRYCCACAQIGGWTELAQPCAQLVSRERKGKGELWRIVGFGYTGELAWGCLGIKAVGRLMWVPEGRIQTAFDSADVRWGKRDVDGFLHDGEQAGITIRGRVRSRATLKAERRVGGWNEVSHLQLLRDVKPSGLGRERAERLAQRCLRQRSTAGIWGPENATARVLSGSNSWTSLLQLINYSPASHAQLLCKHLYSQTLFHTTETTLASADSRHLVSDAPDVAAPRCFHPTLVHTVYIAGTGKVPESAHVLPSRAAFLISRSCVVDSSNQGVPPRGCTAQGRELAGLISRGSRVKTEPTEPTVRCLEIDRSLNFSLSVAGQDRFSASSRSANMGPPYTKPLLAGV
ncbi:hypothetical protein BJ546DRAFT_221215 [Cryomyces antarcticus]